MSGLDKKKMRFRPKLREDRDIRFEGWFNGLKEKKELLAKYNSRNNSGKH